MDEKLKCLPYPGNDDCPGCPLWSDENQCCMAGDAEECAQVNGLI